MLDALYRFSMPKFIGACTEANLCICQVDIGRDSASVYLELVMADGTVKSDGYSPTNGMQDASFVLHQGEHIVKVEASQGCMLKGLKFYTSWRRESAWFGAFAAGFDTVRFGSSQEQPIIGFERVYTGSCSRIQRAQFLKDPPVEVVQVSAGSFLIYLRFAAFGLRE